MLILRSIPFSFAILWRMALVMPFVLLALMVFSGMFLLWFVTISLLFPSIAIVIGSLVLLFPLVAFFLMLALSTASMSVIPTMVGSRLGLQARGIIVKTGPGKMILPALGYGLLEGIISIVLMSLGIGVFLLVSPLSVDQLATIVQSGSEQAIMMLFMDDAGTIGAIIIGVFVIMGAFRTGLLGPIAGASIGVDPNGSSHTPFFGYGTRYFSLLVVMLMSGIAGWLMTPGVAFLADQLGLMTPVVNEGTSVSEQPVFDFATWKAWVLLGFVMLWWTWLFAIQCAGGVLAYLEKRDDYDALREAEVVDRQMAREDVRSLWKERMHAGRH